MKGYRHWNSTQLYWVSHLPGHGGKDWGYTSAPSDAIQLSPYWQRRFAADCRHGGATAQFI